MTFLGYPQGTKGYLFMRGPNNVLFTAVQALFNETLFLKCPDMCHPGYTPVAPPVDAQGEYNIPPDDNENEDDGGVNLYPAPPGRFVPYQASLPPARPQGLLEDARMQVQQDNRRTQALGEKLPRNQVYTKVGICKDPHCLLIHCKYKTLLSSNKGM